MANQRTGQDLFGKSGFLSGLTEEQRELLSRKMTQKTVEDGETLFFAGEKGDKAYFVSEGEIELSTFDHKGEKIVFKIVGPGELFGEFALLDNEPRSATAQALGPSRVRVLEKQDFIPFLKEHPDAAIAMLNMFATRLRETDELLRGKTSRNPNLEYTRRTSVLERAFAKLGDFTGTTSFFIINVVIILAWFLVNIFDVPFLPHFDPADGAFAWLQLYLGSLMSFFVTLFVMMSENVNAEKDRIRNDIQYQVNLKAELQIGQLRERLEELHKDLNERLGSASRLS